MSSRLKAVSRLVVQVQINKIGRSRRLRRAIAERSRTEGHSGEPG